MGDKYYTPDISEFFVGFEFEFFNETSRDIGPACYWETMVLDDSRDMFYFKMVKEMFEHAEYFLRVKYLDRADIESFGFTLDKDKGGVLKKNGIETSYFVYDKEAFKGCCIDLRSSGKYQIFHGHFNSFRGNLYFHGEIKNKSELGKVLKMIGYEK